MGGRRVAVHAVERRDNESADTNKAVRQILEETWLEAHKTPQSAAHISHATPIRRYQHQAGAVEAGALGDRDYAEISALPIRSRCRGGECTDQYA